ncbi:hypothetical protein [Micromonospora sp. NBRC 107095]|uniref:DUF7341 domain-containing protein n=1 Tax=Micromonospora sp. NBRC 107095 TaxID=3032209 RepID=UPI0024A4BF6D|nr:hypothetical protein [Micromonospora sp. NBRC 107095]GLZ62861.1 hypothetical protein Misp05_64370 [Micromonospora sp. NBRC 107095]
MDRDATITTITGLAAALCDTGQHTERVPYWDDNRNKKYREHRTIQPGLLAQLHQAAVEPAAGRTEPGPRSVPQSRPPLALEALSTHAAICTHVHHWCWSLGLTPRDTVEGNIRALVGAAPTLDGDDLTLLTVELRTWHRWASVATGWTTPLYQPHVPCPACQTVGKLRINLHTQAAHCRACQATWGSDDGSLYKLGEYVQAHTNRKVAA